MTNSAYFWQGMNASTGDAVWTTNAARLVYMPICPDLLDYEMIGAADTPRGKVVRAFFWLMRFWPV